MSSITKLFLFFYWWRLDVIVSSINVSSVFKDLKYHENLNRSKIWLKRTHESTQRRLRWRFIQGKITVHNKLNRKWIITSTLVPETKRLDTIAVSQSHKLYRENLENIRHNHLSSNFKRDSILQARNYAQPSIPSGSTDSIHPKWIWSYNHSNKTFHLYKASKICASGPFILSETN